MSETYYSLIQWHSDSKEFSIEFGDYDKSVVQQEKEDFAYSNNIPKTRLKVIASGDTQAEIKEQVTFLTRMVNENNLRV